MQTKTAVLFGATGVIGRYLVQHLSAHGWAVIGIARNPPDAGSVRYRSVDMLDPESCRQELGQLKEATHIFYAAT